MPPVLTKYKTLIDEVQDYVGLLSTSLDPRTTPVYYDSCILLASTKRHPHCSQLLTSRYCYYTTATIYNYYYYTTQLPINYYTTTISTTTYYLPATTTTTAINCTVLQVLYLVSTTSHKGAILTMWNTYC